MRKRRTLRILMAPVILTILLVGFGTGVEQLWNWLMPAIFALHPITFWQAIGLLALSWILFGGRRGFGIPRHARGFRGNRWRQAMRERWQQMTPDEREKFSQGIKNRCGGDWRPSGA